MTIRRNARVTLTVTGYSDEDIRTQIKNSLQLTEGHSDSEVPSEWDIRNKKLDLVKMLRDFEKKFYTNNGAFAPKTGLIDLKRFVEDTFNI